MASITMKAVSKRFGSTAAVREVDLHIPDKQFIVLLGPSGCGKSTILRMLAGLEPVSSGSIEIAGRPVEHLEPKERDLAFVFQSYALYPHMSVRRNIAFPLMMRDFKWWYHLPLLGFPFKRRLERRADIRQHVETIAATLELTDMLDRHPRTLSGGQRQRVAVGRAMVRDPAAFLMDEPLSNLDAKLRVHMRSEIVRLHQQVDTTFVYVTHDQTEAMTMGTRIVVLRDGAVQQYDTPRRVFMLPSNVFVARFIGSPPMNLVPAQITGPDRLLVHGTELVLPERQAKVVSHHRVVGSAVLLGVRPEAISRTTGSAMSLRAEIDVVEDLGSETLVGLRFGRAGAGIVADEEEVAHSVFARLPGFHRLQLGGTVAVELSLDDACLFDPSSEQRLTHPDETDETSGSLAPTTAAGTTRMMSAPPALNLRKHGGIHEGQP